MRKMNTKQFLTTPMNEWDFIDQDTLVVLGKSATINKFKQRCGLVREERLVLSNPHSS
jgi:hypothetical protein